MGEEDGFRRVVLSLATPRSTSALAAANDVEVNIVVRKELVGAVTALLN